jgi:hypothetical protein
MERKNNNLHSSKILSSDIVIEFPGTHSHRIGLSYFPFGSIKRNRFFNPLFILIVISFLFVRCIITMTSCEKTRIYSYISETFLTFSMKNCISILV